MVNSVEATKTIKVILFSGHPQHFKIWMKKMMASANRRGFGVILSGKTKCPTWTEYEAALAATTQDAAQKDTIKRMDLNELAYEELLLSIDTSTEAGQVAFELVANCELSGSETGDAYTAMQRLINKYQPKTTTSYIQLKKDFDCLRLESVEDDPDEFITKLEGKRNELNRVKITGKSEITEVDLVLQVLTNLPEEYEVAISALESRMNDPTTTVTISDVRDSLNTRFSRMKQQNSRESLENKYEKALAALEISKKAHRRSKPYSKQYKGRCTKCGKYGHKSSDCKEDQRNTDDGMTTGRGPCFNCGKYGHHANECKSRNKRHRDQARLAIEQSDSESESDYESDDESIDELGFITTTIPTDEDRINFDSNEKAMRLCTIDGETFHSFNKMTVIGDTGASSTVDNDDSGMEEVEEIDEYIEGVGGKVHVTKKGYKWYDFQQVDGSSTQRRLKTKYCPSLQVRLMSITAELSSGAQLSNDKHNNLVLTYEDGDTIVFDRRIKTRDGWVAGVEMTQVCDNIAAPAITSPILYVDEGTMTPVLIEDDEAIDDEPIEPAINVNEYHKMLGHPNEVLTRSTAAARGIRLSGTFTPCEDCAVGKSKRKKLRKESVERAKAPGERMFLDISSPKTVSIGGSNHWALFLDDASDQVFSFFISKKSDLAKTIVPFIKTLKSKRGITVKTIRCDNAGENRSLQEMCEQEGLNITFEYTAPGTPQQNGRVERKFATLGARIRAMLNGSGIEPEKRSKFWTEAASTATKLHNELVHKGATSNPFQQFFGKGVKSTVDSTKIFGEMCMVHNWGVKKKFDGRSTPCIWLGYADNHAAGTYRVYNPETRRVRLSRSVTFLRESYGDYNKRKQDELQVAEAVKQKDWVTYHQNDEDEYSDMPALVRRVSSSDDEDSDDEGDADNQDGDATSQAASQTTSNDDDEVDVEAASANPKVVSAMKQLECTMDRGDQNILADQILSRSRVGTRSKARETANCLIDVAMVSTEQVTTNEYKEPKTFAEAWFHPDSYQRKQWRAAITKEYGDMTARKVYTKMKRELEG